MYLKSIKAQGFKSFADKLDLEINPGITGVVGPNGSGKSNIVDAVRWVLGEQSVKSLRGASGMTDCIFSGSESREASKRAMVALTFDNTDKYLNSDYSEVEIKRIIYATGENEYYINNTKVRLKDITDLFIDSGAGSSSFNIISQGNVTDIVNSKAIDRRVIFEASAGVLKYKKRKEESLKKLEKTEENITRIKLVTNELSGTVEPLREQSIVAEKYLEINGELENIDIALIVKDITDYNANYSTLKLDIDNLKDKLSNLNATVDDATLEKLKFKNITLEETISKKREDLINLSERLNNLNSEKTLTIERQKYEANSDVINENLLKLKEQELDLQKNIAVATKDTTDLENNIITCRNAKDKITNDILVLKVKRSNTNSSLMEDNKKVYIIQNRIDILENNILSSESAPLSVKNVLNNPRLKGIHNTIGKLIDIPEKYVIATDIALGASSNYIVVESEASAMSAIDFLKERKLGRATFYPINIIKSRYISDDVFNDIKGIKGYIGVLSDLITFDSKYQNIIENQLGQVIVVDNASTMNTIGKLINYKYRIVTLDGEILHVGGSVTGGSSKKSSMLNEKNELKNLKEELAKLNIAIDNRANDIKELDENIKTLEEKESELGKKVILLDTEFTTKKDILDKLTSDLKNVSSELAGMNDLKNNSLDNRLVELMEDINTLNRDKEILEKDIFNLTSEKSTLVEEINVLERKQKDANSTYNSLNNELKTKEIESGKLEVKLDNLLDTLNSEYNLTYEAASLKYNLDMDTDIARDRVNKLRRELNKLGSVNLGAIEEYDRVSKRYEFLLHQQEDLEASSKELKDIISEMDEIMSDKFSKSFNSIKDEFARIFKLMFKGGKGELLLSDPDDLLNTGIDIIAIPPGKKINSPLSLSGGEKALTAICLLFAMLKVKPSPFVILDEAEAALDEVNVDMFGKYLNEEKKTSQFIVITHKKRMMEYADSLYGITMQESGVSKIVSARLENV